MSEYTCVLLSRASPPIPARYLQLVACYLLARARRLQIASTLGEWSQLCRYWLSGEAVAAGSVPGLSGEVVAGGAAQAAIVLVRQQQDAKHPPELKTFFRCGSGGFGLVPPTPAHALVANV